MSCRARYEVVENEPGRPLIIRDIGTWGRQPTVTNDIEDVVETLAKDGLLPEGRKLHYYDSEGNLDEVIVANGAFVEFGGAVQ